MFPHSAEVYIGFELTSSCPRLLISPTAACTRCRVYIRVDFQLTLQANLFTVHANYFWQWWHRETGSKPRSRLARDQQGISAAADRAESASRFSTLELFEVDCLSETHFVRKCLEHVSQILRTMNILARKHARSRREYFWIFKITKEM